MVVVGAAVLHCRDPLPQSSILKHSHAHTRCQVRVAVIGNVDSGKSTMVGVLTRSMLDDGRGLARSKART
jgi:GTPase